MIDESPDDLESLLAPRPVNASAHLQANIRRRTEGVLKRRRIVRRMGKVGIIAAVFWAGIALGWNAATPTPPNIVNLERQLALVRPKVETPPAPQPLPEPEPETAGLAELLAEQATDRSEAARLYRLAGDKYLNDLQDYRNAARCYRLYLGQAGDDALQLQTTDTWLLTSVKNAAFQEKYDDANRGG
ncbi:MAG TPA: hypothetical protein VN641_14395 [Urbifossiella sp.]|nr:hypothetical protein [Urbifossiella sp.]